MRGFYPRILTSREVDVGVGAGRESCPEAPRPAVALVATFHTVPPMPHCLTCLSVPVRALTTSAARPETSKTPLVVLLEEAAPKPKVFLQGVTHWSLPAETLHLLPQQVSSISSSTIRCCPSVFQITQTQIKHSLCLTTVSSVLARSSLTLKGLMTVLARVI